MTTPTDTKQMLEDIALALGLDYYHIVNAQIHLRSGATCNPLYDDGDCARMETALDINIEYSSRTVAKTIMSYRFNGGKIEHQIIDPVADHPDKQTARRWASCRVAAAVGKAIRESENA